MSSREKAPDGKPWPNPRVAVDLAEQNPLCFGHKPLPWDGSRARGEGSPVHSGERDPFAMVTQYLDGPWRSERRFLSYEGDYQLLGPDGALLPKDLGIAIETKRRDLHSSLLHGHDELVREMQRLSSYRRRYLIASTSYRALAEDREARSPGRERSLIGTIESIAYDHGVQIRMIDDLRTAEYVVAWILRRHWRWYLRERPEVLSECRRVEEQASPVAAPEAIPDTRVPPNFEPVTAQLGGDRRARKAVARRVHEGAGR